MVTALSRGENRTEQRARAESSETLLADAKAAKKRVFLRRKKAEQVAESYSRDESSDRTLSSGQDGKILGGGGFNRPMARRILEKGSVPRSRPKPTDRGQRNADLKEATVRGL